jgi:SAM-dependent methyltransferase
MISPAKDKFRAADPVELERIYARRFEAETAYRLKIWKTLVDDFFSSHIAPDAAVLDLGCGYGQFINNIRAHQKYAMDLNPRARQLLAPDVHFLDQDCSSAWMLPSDTLDVVFTSNFFEHLPDKRALSDTLAEAYRCLRPDGRLIAMGPNIKFLPGVYWDFFDHHLPLSELSLKEALEIAGFRCLRVTARFPPYTMVNAPRYPTYFLSAYLKLPLLWRLFGRQFLIIAAKAGVTEGD